MKRRALFLTLALLLALTACAAPRESPEPPCTARPEPVAVTKPTPAPPVDPKPSDDPKAADTPEPSDAPSPPESEPEPDPDAFVRVADYVPGIVVDLRYATADNFTGQVIYDFDDAWLRFGTAQKLAEAQRRLSERGCGMKLWDAFRPAEAQWRLWEACPDPAYVADPRRGFSSHSRGNTVDVTLVDLEGNELPMPTGFDDFSSLADRDYSDVRDPEAAANARLLEEVMSACGFHPYTGEWWHFSDSDTYPVEETFIPQNNGGSQ